MHDFARIAAAAASTRSRLEKASLLDGYFARLDAARTANDMAGAIRSAMGLPIGPDPRGDVLAALARGPARSRAHAA